MIERTIKTLDIGKVWKLRPQGVKTLRRGKKDLEKEDAQGALFLSVQESFNLGSLLTIAKEAATDKRLEKKRDSF